METINLSKELQKPLSSQPFLSKIILTALGGATSFDVREIVPDTTNVKVEFKINGVDVPFTAFTQQLEENWERVVMEQAALFLQDRMEGTATLINRLQLELERITEEVINAERERIK